jgi:hypothetical protein
MGRELVRQLVAEARNVSMGFVPENQVRTRLHAGGGSLLRTRLGNWRFPGFRNQADFRGFMDDSGIVKRCFALEFVRKAYLFRRS